ncbi:MAG TPA: class II aldolase/adducin family protein [Candidatus Limnocylindria bacterium]|nr:class II aldolase/adducin family protein [Candidatus Limnocylindria bacterium]
MSKPLADIVDRSTTDESALKRDLVRACRILAGEGQGDNIYGHVSARLPGAGLIWMKGSGVALDEAREEHLVRIDLAGERHEGWPRRHEEWPIHTELMRERPEVTAVVHTHPMFGIAFAARGLELRPVSHEGAYFWPPGVPTFAEFTDLVRTPTQGAAVSRRLGNARAVYLRNHGVAVVGPTVAEACYAALMLERASEIQLLASSSVLDAHVHHTSEEEALRKRAMWYPGAIRAAFDYLARKHGLVDR